MSEDVGGRELTKTAHRSVSHCKVSSVVSGVRQSEPVQFVGALEMALVILEPTPLPQVTRWGACHFSTAAARLRLQGA